MPTKGKAKEIVAVSVFLTTLCVLAGVFYGYWLQEHCARMYMSQPHRVGVSPYEPQPTSDEEREWLKKLLNDPNRSYPTALIHNPDLIHDPAFRRGMEKPPSLQSTESQ